MSRFPRAIASAGCIERAEGRDKPSLLRKVPTDRRLSQARLSSEMSLSLLPSIDGDGLFGIRPAAGADNAGQLVDIKGHMTKGDAQTRSFRGDVGVIGPGVYPHAPVREVGQLPVIGQADAARIDIPGVAQAPHLLRVGMPTAQQCCNVATQELSYNVIWHLGENDLVEGTRRSMKTEQGLLGFQRDLERGVKLLDKGDVALRELRERPGPDFSLVLTRLFTRRRVLAPDQPGISVAHHDLTVQFT